MSTFKKAKAVMLPNNQQTKYLMVYSDVEKTKGKLILNGLKNDEYKEYQHLYIISDDEIKENNTHFYNPHSGQLHISGNHTDYIAINKNGCKKIIATTDVSLGLPQPSKQFIQKYIEEYNKDNKDNIITDVLIEYELISNEEYFGNTINPDDDVPYFDERLKINSKDNTITIKKVKDSYSREEVIEFGNKVKEYCKDGWKPDSLHRVFFEWDKWIEENL